MTGLFEPLEFNSIRLKNRLLRSATWIAAASPTGEVTDALVSRTAELARGGCSIVVTGFTYISPEGAMLPAMVGADSDARVPSLARLADAVHDADGEAKVFCQLVHTGIARLPFVRTTYADTFAADETTDPFVEMGGTGETCEPAGPDRIAEVIGKWAAAAVRCKEAGFDGVELHFAHGFGPGAWFSPLWNHRTDEWGGSRERRARYGIEVLKAVREAVGVWPVTAKINCEDGIDGGTTTDDAIYFACRLAEVGIEGLVISGGSFAAPPARGAARLARQGREEGKDAEGYFAGPTARIRAALQEEGKADVIVIGVGGWRTPAIMEKHLGPTCDAFALSRPLLNDPGIVNKWAEDPSYVTECVSCNKCMKGQGIVTCRKHEGEETR